MRSKRTITVYALLAVAWIVIACWQLLEHSRTADAARASLLNRARDISMSLGVVIRSQGRFVFVRRSRLEAALEELVGASDELLAVALVNKSGDIMGEAGDAFTSGTTDWPGPEPRWEAQTLMVGTLVDLGPAVEDGETTRPAGSAIVLGDHPPTGSRDRATTNSAAATSGPLTRRATTVTSASLATPRPTEERRAPSSVRSRTEDAATTSGSSVSGDDRGRSSRGRRGRRPRMTREQFQELIQQRGLHQFVLVMSTQAVQSEIGADRGLRLVLGGLSLLALLGLGVAWKGLARSAGLEQRLLRAKEMNEHLREMNVAAAGLAHETRNPLNIVRGLAQMISKKPEVAAETRGKMHEVIEEVDRVTSRLNEFIDYS
ncbi:histidine kinase dimerization/phospho-acceptor domain-containing protein, partial [Candidatus Sumerlaeota bacterium]